MIRVRDNMACFRMDNFDECYSINCMLVFFWLELYKI